ncbi:SOS response-associated peptidase [Pseudomonas schmalbachii]|uniref:Abasic site processing protein n=1 Tax=Pseudomonas schmalbachii TaxID=2816993 RepID=A0ABS3TKE6_9PSED|nr:SOS response-associated peptidase [Pseudomonas schmalbachii]MBO3274116.1 SOS response-associated peptidase [Pseudomonas schmalbachii]
MCGRYVTREEAAMERYWHIGARNSGRWIRRIYNVAPTNQVPMVVLNDQAEQEVVPARWGLIPTWWKQAKPPSLSFNARSEEAATKPMWRQAIRTHRCLMPAAGWYEWNEHEQVRNRAGRRVNQPYYHHAIDDQVLAIAGLWSSWIGPDGQDVLSCALLTRDSAGPVAAIHHRMPVILAPEQWSLWLSPSTPPEQVHSAIALSRTNFDAYRVSTDVGDVRNQGEQLIEPVRTA